MSNVYDHAAKARCGDMSGAGARILVTDDLERFLRMSLYRAGYDIAVCSSMRYAALEALAREQPDILLLSAARREEEMFRLARSICRLPLTKTPVPIAVFSLPSAEKARKLMTCGVLSASVMGGEASDVIRLCAQVTVADRLTPDYARRERVEAVLRELSVNPALAGFRYLADAIELCARDQSGFHKLTTTIYPEVARKNHTGTAAVERLIRHAIENAWLVGDIDRQYAYFGNTVDAARGKPTNSELIARVTETLRLEASKR